SDFRNVAVREFRNVANREFGNIADRVALVGGSEPFRCGLSLFGGFVGEELRSMSLRLMFSSVRRGVDNPASSTARCEKPNCGTRGCNIRFFNLVGELGPLGNRPVGNLGPIG